MPPANLQNYHFQVTIHVTFSLKLLEALVSDFPVLHPGSVYMQLQMEKNYAVGKKKNKPIASIDARAIACFFPWK